MACGCNKTGVAPAPSSGGATTTSGGTSSSASGSSSAQIQVKTLEDKLCEFCQTRKGLCILAFFILGYLVGER